MKKLLLLLCLLAIPAPSWAASEQICDLASTTVGTTQASGSTSLVVTSASTFCTNPPFTVGVDTGANYELERVTVVSGTTFTVTRSASLTHSAGAAVVAVMNSAAFANLNYAAPAQLHIVASPGSSQTPTCDAGATQTSYIYDIGSNLTVNLGTSTCAAGQFLILYYVQSASSLAITYSLTGVAQDWLANANAAGTHSQPALSGNTYTDAFAFQYDTSTGTPTFREGGQALGKPPLLSVANGGTGLGTLTAHALYAGNGTTAPSAVGPDAATVKALTSAGASADPAYQYFPAAPGFFFGTPGTGSCENYPLTHSIALPTNFTSTTWPDATAVVACSGAPTGGSDTFTVSCDPPSIAQGGTGSVTLGTITFSACTAAGTTLATTATTCAAGNTLRICQTGTLRGETGLAITLGGHWTS